jgi:carbon-monoxide dehydrogenase medium subunit
VIPAAFDYYRASSVADALQLLQTHPDAKLLAGGHSLIPLMKLRLAEPPALIDIGGLRDLAGIREEHGEIVIGAMTRHHAIETSELLHRRARVVAEAASTIGDMQVRNRGTIGGSLVHADPGADMPAVMLAMEAGMVVHTPNGERRIPADEFFLEMMTTAVEPNEILTEVRIPPLPDHSGSAYVKFPNPASGYSVVGAAAIVVLDQRGTLSDVRIGLSGAAPTPVRASGVESALVGQLPMAETLLSASQAAADGLDALEDIHASAEYRQHLARVLTRRALETAVSRAQA